MRAAPSQPAADSSSPAAPGLARRMASFAYEGVLLFGVLFVAGYLYSTLTQQRHALQGQTGLQAFAFIVLGIYFTLFWSRAGQTVAMRAWNLRLVTVDGAPVSQRRALARYLASWIWFVPALLTAHVAGLNSALEILVLLIVGIVVYALLAFAHPQRQFWHDALCGTRLIDWRGGENPRAQSAG
ncbi:MAG: RDD family protein [Aquincola sp.]|nr:RDD family protein [Aquincola sp.]MDH4288096.1 RDD family protein [Aquincola sp.]